MSKKEEESPQSLQVAGIEIPVADQSPLVLALLGIIKKQEQEILELRDEIQRLKKTTVRPDIKPSRLLDPPKKPPSGKGRKRPGSAKRKKTKDLRIDVDEIIVPDHLPLGSTLEGYRDFVVQDIVIGPRNTPEPCHSRAAARTT